MDKLQNTNPLRTWEHWKPRGGYDTFLFGMGCVVLIVAVVSVVILAIRAILV